MRQTIHIFTTIAGTLLILLNLRKGLVLYANVISEPWTAGIATILILIGVVLARYVAKYTGKQL